MHQKPRFSATENQTSCSFVKDPPEGFRSEGLKTSFKNFLITPCQEDVLTHPMSDSLSTQAYSVIKKAVTYSTCSEAIWRFKKINIPQSCVSSIQMYSIILQTSILAMAITFYPLH